jgi:HSP20 family protein
VFRLALGERWETSPQTQLATTMNALITDGNQPWRPSEQSGRFAPVFAAESFRPGDLEGRFAIEEWVPRFDLIEDDHELLLETAVPEMKRLEVRISTEDGALTVSGERRFEEKEPAGASGENPREYGHFWRSFTLPEGTQCTKVSAEFTEGVLRVHVPKEKPAPSRAVEASADGQTRNAFDQEYRPE